MLDQSQGWILFTDEECTQVYDFNTAVYGATTLYVKTVPAITVESVTNTFSYAAIDTTEISKRPATGKDKNAPDTSPIYNSDFGGTVNSFLNIVNEEANLVTYRTSNSCIENRDAGLSVYFPQNGGTITIKFASTGSSNKSRLGLCYTEWEYDEKTGESHEVTKWIKANDGTTATLVTGDADEGAYEVSGTSVVEITFTVAQGGTYYISCPSGITTRGARIMAVKQVSNAYKEQAILVESVDILGNNSETGEEEIVTNKTVELIAGSQMWLNLSINNRQYSNYIEKIEWKSGDENKFTVTPENDGMYASLSGLAAGDATLTVTVTDKAGKTFTASVTITVKSQGVESIIIADTLIATVGNSESVEVSIYPENASNQEVIWEVTEGADVVSVENGLVTGLKEGTATIKVTSSDNSEVSATCTVTVINQAVESVSLNVSETTVSVGKTETLVATINPENASNKNVSWSSDNTSVATVENGVVTGVAEGTATITVTTEDGGYTATCTVTVSGVVDVEHSFNSAKLVDAGVAVGSSKTYSNTGYLEIDGFKIINKISNKAKGSNDVSDYLSFANVGDAAKFTTDAENMTFKLMFEGSSNGRSITITGPDGFSQTIDYTSANKNVESTVNLGKAGEYTITVVGGEIKFYYMSFTNKEAASATKVASANQLEATEPASNKD